VTAIVAVQSRVTQRVLSASSMLAIIYWPTTLSVCCPTAVPWRNLFDSANIGPGNQIGQKFPKAFRWTTAINVPTVLPSSLDNLDLKGKLINSTYTCYYYKHFKGQENNLSRRGYKPITNLSVGFRFFSWMFDMMLSKLQTCFKFTLCWQQFFWGF